MSEKFIPEVKEHYPYVTRSLIRLFGKQALTNVTSIDVEPKYGYVSRLSYTDGSHRVTYGNDLGLNTGSAENLANDKGHTKFMLRSIGVECPEGEEFLLPWWAETISKTRSGQSNKSYLTTSSADEYITEHMDYPVYLKPVNGSKGADIYKLHDKAELSDALDTYNEKRVRVAMIEEPITMPDYRIVTLDGELISAYQRVPLAVTGDGTRTIRELLEVRQNEFNLLERDTNLDKVLGQIEKHIAKQSMTLESVVGDGDKLSLVPISNLSAGGESVDVSDKINERWAELAANVADNFDLRLAGLDLACQDITSADSEYSVLEVNSTPGLDHYAMSGDEQRQIVDDLYIKVLNAFPRRGR
jgi:D-alanine-D-alanine ligase-like ATP-grasp enzyme